MTVRPNPTHERVMKVKELATRIVVKIRFLYWAFRLFTGGKA